ncbi:MAG: hypothetical protein FWH03_08440 [Firmicutes bacterium]|nr:hypothetical protein [Bacillota bacterium]
MSKIIHLSTDAEYYYEKAIQKSDANDYVGCLELLRRAAQFVKEPYGEDGLSIRLEIADTYSFMELYEESNREYFKLTAFDYALDEVYYGIVKNFVLMSMPEEAAHFLNFAVDAGILSPEDGFDPPDLGMLTKPVPSDNIRLVKSDNGAYALSIAKQLLNGKDTQFARQMLQSVSEKSELYAEAINLLAFIEISEGKTETGLVLCEKALALNPNDIYALTARIMALDLSGKRAKAAAYLDELDAIGLEEWPDIAKIALCACQINANETAFKYLAKCMRHAPFDRSIGILYGIAAANEGEIRTAKHKFVQLQIIYPRDAAVRYFARKTDMLNGKKANFVLNPELPDEVIQDFSKLLDKQLASITNAVQLNEKMRQDDNFFDAAEWGLYGTESAAFPYAAKIGGILALSNSGNALVRDILLDPEYPIVPKKEIFTQLLKSGKQRVIALSTGDDIRYFRPAPPKEIKTPSLLEAYWRVYSALAFIDMGFDRKLNLWFRKLALALKGVRNINIDAAAAVLAYKSRINKIFNTQEAVCEVFNLYIEGDDEDFDAYCAALDAVTGQARSKKSTLTKP